MSTTKKTTTTAKAASVPHKPVQIDSASAFAQPKVKAVAAGSGPVDTTSGGNAKTLTPLVLSGPVDTGSGGN